MTINELALAFDFTENAISGIGDDQWDQPTPCSEWDVRHLVNHTIGAVFGMGMAASGQPAPAAEPPDFTTGDPARTFRQAADAALEAWPAALDKTVNLGPAEMPGSIAIDVNLLDTLTHGWDIASATGQPTELPEASARVALSASRAILTDELRADAGFAAPTTIPDGATLTDQLVAFLGRQP